MGSEKSNKHLVNQLNDLNKKLEESNMTLGDYEAMKRKIAAENGDLLRVAGDINNNLMMIQKVKASLTANLEEAKSVADNEARERGLLLGKYKNMEFELDGVKEHLDEEVSSREEVGRQTKMKLSARLTEAESSIENMNSKLHQIEKARTKLQGEMEEMNHNLDQAQILTNEMDKKAKHFDRIV